MAQRIAVSGAIVAIPLLMAMGMSVKAAGASSPSGRTIDGCTIVAHPTAIHQTTCPAGDLSGAGLSNTDLSYADLTGAALTAADLGGAKLVDAFVTGADLTGADLTGADLTGADLTNAQLSAVIWNHTRCPDGSLSNEVGGSCVDDLTVVVGAAIGSGPLVSSSAPSAPGDGVASSSVIPSSSTLAFTGQATEPLVGVGLGAIASGLILIRLARPARKREAQTLS